MKVPRAPPPSSRRATAVMKANRGKNTGPELALRRSLRGRGIHGYRVSPRMIPGRPDVTFIGQRVAVFVHDCFWHQHGCRHAPHGPRTNASYWRLKFTLNRARDARKVALLEKSGWNVLVIWECEIKQNAERCASRVSRELALPHRPIPKAIYPTS